MTFQNYLKEKQPLIYKTFLNAREQEKLAHAYLIKGIHGSPLLETVKYLAKSLVCASDGYFACEMCDTCHRFDENNYADFILLDAQKETIRVMDIENLEKRFSTKTMEAAGKMIYIIHHVENMNRESVNALLKFLEEPKGEIYAFLTTENESKVLPTILSRCQHLKMLPPSKEDLRQEMKDLEIEEEDLELLSDFASDKKTLKEFKESESYCNAKEVLLKYLSCISRDLEEGYYYIQKEGITKIRSKEEARLFIDMLGNLFKDMLNISYHLESKYPFFSDTLLKVKDKIHNIEECYKEILFTRGRIELNVTISLILEHIAYSISKGGNKK